MLPKGFLEEIRARVSVSEVIGKRIKITRAGREYKACCPFHHEKTPSFTINDEKGFYHCFGCGAHGDVIRFLTEHDNLNFMEAIEQLAGIAGLHVPKPTPEEAEKFKRQLTLYDVMNATTDFFARQLHARENIKVLEYLLDRGLTHETIKAFRLGYAPRDYDVRHISNAHFKKEDFITAGVFRQSDRREGEVYPFFRGRVMFPVRDVQGRVIAFGGRILPGADSKAPKYINSAETPIFHKGSHLYGLTQARQIIGDHVAPLVVEGYMDVIALHQAGFRSAVAPLGTALTENQILSLWKVMPPGVKAPVLCFDGDTAGQRAAARALDRILPILKPDHSARFAFLPDGQDPDSLVKSEGRNAMEKIISDAVSLFDMMWQVEAEGRNFSQPETRAGFRSSLISRARLIADTHIQEFFISEIDQRIKATFLNQNINKNPVYNAPFRMRKPGTDAPIQRFDNRRMTRLPRARKYAGEKVLLAAMIRYPYLYEEFSEEFGMIPLQSMDYGHLRQAMITLLDQQKDLDYQAVKTHLVEVGLEVILGSIFDGSVDVEAGFAAEGQEYDKVRQGWIDMYERCKARA